MHNSPLIIFSILSAVLNIGLTIYIWRHRQELWSIFRRDSLEVSPFARDLLIESMSDGVLVLDTHNRIVDINPAMQKLIGPAMVGQPAETVFTPWPHLIERFRDIAEVQTEIIINGTTPEYFDLCISPLLERRGQSIGRLVIVRDITKYKQTEAALRASENNFRSMLESAPDAMLIVDRSGKITMANAQAEKIFRYPKSELLDQFVENLIASHLHEIHRSHRESYMQDPQARPMGATRKWELMALRKDGNQFPVEISLSPLEAETGLLTIAAVRDISERKQMETQLRLQSTALEAAANAVVITDHQDVIQWINPAYTRLTGYTLAEALGQTVEVLRSNRHDEAFYTGIQKTIHAGLVWEGELVNRRKDGVEYAEEQTITPVHDQNGEINHFIAIKQDITARRQMEAKLRESEERLRTIIEISPDGITVTDLEGYIVMTNQQLAVIQGYENAKDMIGMHILNLLVPEDRARMIEVSRSLLSTSASKSNEFKIVRRDGSTLQVELRVSVMMNENKEPQAVIGITRDITDRKHAEEELRHKNEYLETLHQIALDLLNQRNVDDVLETIMKYATQLLDAPYGDFVIIEGDVMVVRAHTENQPILKGIRVRRGEGAVAAWQAYDTQQPIIFDDYSTWPQRNPILEPLSHHATLIMPIISGDQCLGVFSLARSEANHPFVDNEIQLASLFAQQAALALDNAQLHANAQHEIEQRKRSEEALRSHNDYLAALHEITLGLINRRDPDALLEDVLTRLVTLMKTHHAFIDLVDPTENILIEKVALGNYIPQLGFCTQHGEGLTGQVWDSGETLIIPDYQAWTGSLPEFRWLRTVAGLPMKVEGRVIGVIGISFDEPDRVFTSEEIDLLQRFTDLAAIALDNARLFTGMARQSQELSLLHEVRTAIASEIDLTRIVKRTVQAITETFGYTLVSLYLVKGDMLILQHQIGYDEVIPVIPITKGISGQVVRTGKPVFLEDIRSDPAFLGAVENIISEVCVPIFDEGRAVGILNIESKYGVKLTEADLRLMLAVSDQISVAIGRARLYDSLHRNNARLSLLHEIALDLLNQRELEDLLQSITNNIIKLMDSSDGYIALAEGDELVDRTLIPHNLGYQKVTGRREIRKGAPPWQVFESQQLFSTDDYSSLPNIRPETAALGFKAALLLPILYGEKCQGVLGTLRKKPHYPFNQEDINFGNLFARLAGVAVDNVQLHETLRQESIRDPLTNLFNRRFMEESLAQELQRANRNSMPLAVVMIDLDHLKDLNDTYGHGLGDEALRMLSKLMKIRIRASDIACRYGGDEFTLILPEVSLENVQLRMEELREDAAQLKIRYQGKSLTPITLSVGIAIFPNHGSTGETLLKAADKALYQAKQSGRNRVTTA